MASGPITSWQADGETMETGTHFIFLGCKITTDGECSHEIKRCLILWKKSFDKPRHPGFNSTWTVNFQMFTLDLEKAEEPEIKLPTSVGSSKSKRDSEKHLLLLYWLFQSFWLCGSQQTVGNFSRHGNTRPPEVPPEKSVCRSGSNS